jgi:CRISPR type III-B/RAMP module RAMP protein Cmr1
MEITFRTLTPIWTGGVEGNSNRPRESGIIGSLRWWYEVIVRGLGGAVGDPLAQRSSERYEFDLKAYGKAKRENKTTEEALQEGLKTLGVVEYLFGTTGWARLFRLYFADAPRTPLHFRSLLPMNQGWLERVFDPKNQTLQCLRVLYGDMRLHVSFRGRDVAFARGQLEMLMQFIATYGALGAKPQHGFGQIGELALDGGDPASTLTEGLQSLRAKLNDSPWRSDATAAKSTYSLERFFHQSYQLDSVQLNAFLSPDAHFGSVEQKEQIDYIPCAFDLRYKSRETIGMREWLRDVKGWDESDDPKQYGPVDKLMGPRSEWGKGYSKVRLPDEMRRASAIYFGMPVKVGGRYQIPVFGFAPVDLDKSVSEVAELCQEYMAQAFDIESPTTVLGSDLLALGDGGEE